MASPQELKRYRRNLADELDSAAVYDALSTAESDAQRRAIFAELAVAEREHAQVWREKLAANNVRVPPHRRSGKTLLLLTLTRVFGPSVVLPTVAAAEYADRDRYAHEPGAEKLSAQEQQHAAIVQSIVANKAARGQSKGAQIAAAESWHRGVTSGNDLRAAVLGANDGLVSNFCLIMGVAGAGAANRTILLTGLAGLVAGACSMALGEWLSVTNARELARTQIAKEADELEHTPDAERHELALIYQAKGIEAGEARRVASQIMRDKDHALDTLTREELGIDPKELGGNPWTAAAVSFFLFALGAAFPIVAFLWAGGYAAIAQSVVLSAIGLAAVGVFTSLFNGRSALFSAFRQIVIGLVAAGFTAGAGRLLGVSIS
ncbi:VIT1/CCC1 transporter family protein [Paraburkholderia caballeronis]|uniref:Predicted Fe2+/Mn2+ transporter, VIT1/CCC1 family n=1 Tax=Paraburkholderia caballeronis TaxID=416943 RepID=A0A1H7QFU6_9BURK|nr:VIT1/CCC1 transporter family protein [Paraburkholderia caballeronis]PXW22589.1 VIT1/CCC1 family predicted Fe2+/Mn2+ transporter [Paraburkholderia caballeronis]PXW96460.1 VIT1/CCC1 family predicted Fe2+/Mn2+ transporter [Paraburkholderia caballeronis]RAJ92871.1 VIT1/CCC1 family predicted Fe2+/Mn2+ transporter [Paraburkholderia caballeronis]SEE07824.1 Predicted Fe2+/Mn2+ transporter, VIT1/CCC1 family [Paraburkholderia caballeronis]SEL46628.1 Predicted Fe2+/Mn2+ transporter, VIT1/CCC1 family [